MGIKTVSVGKNVVTEFPLLMSNHGCIWIVTHDQEVGLSRTLLHTIHGKKEDIGKHEVIDDAEYQFMEPYKHILTMENDQ